VDIPRCFSLECLAYLPNAAASKSTLQRIQHHAAPFFRCVLLSGDKTYLSDEVTADVNRDDVTDPSKFRESSDEACHHVHHSSQSELVGFVCATRCHYTPNFNNATDATTLEDRLPQTRDGYLYPTKHEPNGPCLAIHSIVVQKEYQRQGVGRAMLENFIKSVTLYNAELDGHRRHNKIIAKNPYTKIERIVLVCYSSIAKLFISAGFRWKATIKGGIDPLYELEREVDSSPFPDLHQSSVEHDCYLVDAFIIPGERGSGTPTAIVVLHDSPTNLIADNMNSASSANSPQDNAELATERAETWMSSVSKEFSQPVTAFVWRISVVMSRRGSNVSSISDDELNLSMHDECKILPEIKPEMHYAIRLFTGAGIEIDKCAHATLAAASVLFHRDTSTRIIEERSTLSFHFMNELALESPLGLSSLRQPSQTLQVFGTMHPSGIKIEMNCPWRNVKPLPLSPEEEGSVLSMIWQSFMWNDHFTNEEVKSSPVDYVRFVGLTDDGEDLFVELTAEGFDLTCEIGFDCNELKQRWNGFPKGVIICCEVPDVSGKVGDSLLDGHPEGGTANIKEISDDFSIDFCSRYFHSNGHSDVQGSHSALGPYFGARLGKRRLLGLQNSDRGGLVQCNLMEDERVYLIGSTITTITGKTQMNTS
jgi:ribosomal protein S18 acetylase RimI-like enzyme